jgi:hypothetical protein
MVRAFFALLVAGMASVTLAQPAPQVLQGTIEEGVYTSPTGAFRMTAPVLPELGGSVHDTDVVVTFKDSFGLQVTVAAIKQDATQRWELSTRGIKDYLIYFFKNYVMRDFEAVCAGAKLESAGFSADFMDGAIFTYVLLPGGSMFAGKEAFTMGTAPPVAKRGNLTFVKNGFVFVISTELSERVTEGTKYNKTTEEENQILRSRLVDLVKKIEFLKPAPAAQP